MSVGQVFISAINNSISLEVNYDHHLRLVSPIRYGWKTTRKEGRHRKLFCYQFGGYSSKPLRPEGSKENYRCWNLEKIYSAVPVKDEWRSATGWSTHKSYCIDEVIAGPAT